MKKRITAILIMTMLALDTSAGLAAGTLSAGALANGLRVNWDPHCSGIAVMSVYKDNWPVYVENVSCADGEAIASVGRPYGGYSVRLKCADRLLTAGVEVAENTPEPVITMRPTQEPANTPAPAGGNIATADPDGHIGIVNENLAGQVVAQVNYERARYGLSQLRVDGELMRAARVRAREIVEKFSHTRPDGSKWATVSAAAYGENIAKGQKTADKVMAAWLTSDGHRANILKESFGSIGVCAYVSGGVTYWVQLFGK